MMMKNCVFFIFIQCIIFSKAMIGEYIRTPTREFKFVVSIKKYNFDSQTPENDHDATGSLISKRDVLTVAHSLQLLEPNFFEIIAGSVDIRTGLKFLPFWWISYLQWATRERIQIQCDVIDIAIIRLIEKVPDDIIPVVVHPATPSSLFGSDIVIAGWGMTATGTIPRYMKVAVLKIMSKTECENRIQYLTGNYYNLPDNMLCSVADPYVITTPGFSGAPIIYLGTLVAVHKAICPDFPRFQPTQINIHVSIYYFMDFINSIVNNP